MEWLILWPLLCAVVAYAAGQKGRSGVGFFFLSLFLSPLVGLLVLIALPARQTEATSQPVRGSDLIVCHNCKRPRRADSERCPNCGTGKYDPMAELRKCPHCAEMIRREATKCRYCQSDVVPAPLVTAQKDWSKVSTMAPLPAATFGKCPGCGRQRLIGEKDACVYCGNTERAHAA